MCGMPSASSWRSVGSASRARSGSGSTTTRARSATAVPSAPSAAKPTEPGAVDQRVAVAHIIEMHQVELGRAAARPRLGAGVADAGAVRDDCPAGRSRRPQKEGPRLGWSYPPRRGPRARSFWCLQLCWAYASPCVRRAGPRRRRGRAPHGKRPASPFRGEVQEGNWRLVPRGRIRRLPQRSMSLTSPP